MSTGRVLAVSAQVDAQAKTAGARATRLVLLDLRVAFTRNIPHVDPAVICRGGQVATILAQRQRPRLAGFVRRGGDLPAEAPFSRVSVQPPDLHLAAKPCAGGHAAVPGGRDVVGA